MLAGGDAQRLGGADKPGLDVGGMSLLERVVAASSEAGRVIVVGPQRPLAAQVTQVTQVTWCREDPPGAGPVAAVAAGVQLAHAEVVLTLAADLPWIAPAVPGLVAALAAGPGECAALVDDAGRVNYLAAAWRRTSLVEALADLGDPVGASMRTLVSTATITQVPDVGGWGLDCDTWADVENARNRLPRGATTR